MSVTAALHRMLGAGEPEPQLSSEQLSQSIEVLAVLVARAERIARGDARELALCNALHASLWHLVESWAGTVTCELTSAHVSRAAFHN